MEFAAIGAAATAPQQPWISGASKVDEETVPFFAGRHQRDERCANEPTKSQLVKQAVTGTCSGVLMAQHQQEDEETRTHDDVEDERVDMRSLLLSDKDGNSQAQVAQQAIDEEQGQQHRNCKLDVQEEVPLHVGESKSREKLPSFLLVGLLVLFFFLYVGIEVGFGAWVAVVVMRDELVGEAGAARMAR